MCWCAALLVVALAIPASPSFAQSRTLFGVAIPDRVAGLPHEPPHDYERDNPGLGYSVEFLRPDWRIDVYIYDLGMRDIPADPMSDVMERQLKQASGDIYELERRGNYSNVTASGNFAVDDSAGRTRFVCSTFRYRHNGWKSDVDSYLCLTSVKAKFFKVRMTTKRDPDSAAESRRFVQAWIGVLWP